MVSCAECDFQYYSPRPPTAHIEAYYHGVEFYEKINFPAIEIALSLLPESQGKLLDVGCGVGALVAVSRKMGWDAVGMDTSPKAVELAKKKLDLEILPNYFKNTPFQPETFDVIVLLAVLEHVFELVSMMKQVWRLLKPGGTVIFSTPNLDNLPYLLMKNKEEYSWFVKEHINQFTLKTLRTLLKKTDFHGLTFHQCGHFIVERVEDKMNLLPGTDFHTGIRSTLINILDHLSEKTFSKRASELTDSELTEVMRHQINAWSIGPGEYSITHAVYGKAFK